MEWIKRGEKGGEEDIRPRLNSGNKIITVFGKTVPQILSWLGLRSGMWPIVG